MVFMRTRVGRTLPRDEQGAVAVLTALLMVVLILCAAVVVDLGNARDVRRQSQNAADAASLAGANVLYPATGACTLDVAEPCIKDAEAAARSYALKNFQVSDWSTCTVPAGSAPGMVPSAGTPCILFNSATSPTLVRVYLPTRTVATFFGGIAGVSSIPVGSSAQAQLGTPTNCSLCFLGNVNAGNGDFSVFGGSIAVNGNVAAGPQSFWSAQSNGVVGTVSGGTFIPPVTSIPAFGDPLATSLTLPLSTTGLSAKTNPCSATATGGPGLYDAFSLPNSACALQPGLYVISGTWDMKENTVLSGTGVTLYVRSPSGYLDFKNGTVAITSPSTAPLTGVPAGFAIIYDRNNTNNLGLQGNGGTSITGMVYAPASILDFNGNSCFGFSGGPVILDGAITNGNKSCVTISNAVDTAVSRKLLHLNQ
jgi:Putative Flp pilus-assembly TadE/G-like